MEHEGRVYSLTPHEHVEVVSRTRDRLVARVSYSPDGAAPPRHLHPFQDEHFEVLAGRLCVEIDGRHRTLGAGDHVEVPRGAVHRMWNPGDAMTDARWTTMPAGRTEEWWDGLDAVRRRRWGSTVRQLRLLRRFGDVFEIALPGPLRPIGTLLARLGTSRVRALESARTMAP